MTTSSPQDMALQILGTTDMHVFLTGKAGTGKTTFLLNLDKHLSKRMIVLAPTGIAAINAHGMTIHSFFQLPFTPYIPGYEYKKDQNYKIGKNKLELIRSLDLLVIDEISMVRADLLDAIDTELRRLRNNKRAFGGVQVLMIGDLQQLPPVVNDATWDVLRQYYETPYFFSSKVLKDSPFLTIELTKVYRQSDAHFLNILNHIREGQSDPETLKAINCRYIPDFHPQKDEGYIQLMTHNDQVTRINNQYLSELKGDVFEHEAVVKGKFPESSFPTEQRLILKCGAQVMFVKNDLNKRYFNGMLGVIQDIRDGHLMVSPKDNPSTTIDVTCEEWTNVRYSLDKDTHEIIEVLEGTFTQYPVKLAWAITIHKSQGLTFDKVILDVSSSFSHGQTYVALSRCRTLEGIVLSNPIRPSAIISDKVVRQFTESVTNRTVTPQSLHGLQLTYKLRQLTELFSFEKERVILSSLHRFLDVNLYQWYPQTIVLYQEMLRSFDSTVMCVANRFHQQYERLLNTDSDSDSDDFLQERINKAAAYFIDQLVEARSLVSQTDLEIDNAELQQRLSALLENAQETISFHIKMLEHTLQAGFDITDYQHYKTRLMLEKPTATAKSSKIKSPKIRVEHGVSIPAEVKCASLYVRLIEWRKKLGEMSGEKLFRIMPTPVLIAIANTMPVVEDELMRIPKISKRIVENQGREILLMVHDCLNEIKDQQTVSTSQPAPNKTKEKTYEISLRMYREGKTPQQIATERELTVGTIYSHLERYLESGEVVFEDLVGEQTRLKIQHYLKEHPRTESTTLTEIKEALGEDVTFNDIRLTLKHMELHKS